MPIITASINTGSLRGKIGKKLAASFRGTENRAFSFTAYITSSTFKDDNLAIYVSLKYSYTV